MSRLIRTARTATLLLVAILCGAAAAAPPAKVDLNSASLAEVQSLPIPEELARNIVEYRTYVRYFGSIYDVLDVEGMTPAHLAAIKPLAATIPPTAVDAAMARLTASYRQVRNYLGQEGANEALADEYLDMLRDPVNVNELDLFDLQSFQNVSPVDAKAILQARQRLGAFESDRQLRRADGLRYFSFRNLRDFVVYRDDQLGPDDEVHGSYQMRFYDTPYFSGDLADFTGSQALQRGDPYLTHKLSLSLPKDMRAGAMTHRNMGEAHWDETRKGYVGVDDKHLGPLHLKRFYVGNYRVAFGQGLVMDNSDFIQYRRTGFGFNKRPIGVRGDLSRSHEYALTGLAAEGKMGPVHGTVFASWDKKDGIVNPDGTINTYVTMSPRPDDEWLDSHLAFAPGTSYAAADVPDTPTGLVRNAIEEDILGGNVKVMLGDATYVGATAYEARYNRGFRADVSTLVSQYSIDSGLLEARDSEISSGYTSTETAADGTLIEHKFRRVYGAEFQTVVDNVSFQGEYAMLQDPTASFLKGDTKDALVLNGFAQWDNLHLLAIWRDYDVGYDNPYNRGFANDNRYEQTLLDSPFRLNDDYYSWVSLNTPQPKPEKGLFLQTRYRISRTLILNGLEYDRWTREADGTDMTRYTLKVEYQPKFNLRLRMRHRYSSRAETNANDVRWFNSWESRFELITLLSDYNRLSFMFMTSNVWFPPRPRLSGVPVAPPSGSYEGVPGVGTAAIPAHALQVSYEHNLTPGLRLLVSSEIYDGFLWNFEGNEFVVVDGRGFRNWFKVESRVSDQMLFQLKVTRDHNLPRTYLDVRQYGEAYGDAIESSYAPRDYTSFRLQMDYTF
ncbi:MAG TPA: helix-hairpin-helix domain-containing protein [Candidatus Krumholzibacteria bacterium]|nr:helix-hairpin-helix domain-containing protein [Candidatus Krumholzibacteria bacterium]